MAELKTKATRTSVNRFIRTVADQERQADCRVLLDLFARATGEKPVLWGTSIVGYGQYHYQSERSAQKGDWPLTGFSPRKAALTLYIMPGFEAYASLMAKLGRCKTSRSCLYVRRLSDIHLPTLKQLIRRSTADMRRRYPVPVKKAKTGPGGSVRGRA